IAHTQGGYRQAPKESLSVSNHSGQLADQLKGNPCRTFGTRFGSVLDLMEVEIQPEALTTLA
ncbi:hypothetical protein CR513_09241, partial [Mucuna pruriens]